MCNRRRPAATSSRRASFSALASITPSCILHRALQHHWRICMSVIAALIASVLCIFVALGFVVNDVITVMINSPWKADMMQITRAEIIAVLCPLHQFRHRSPAFWIFAIRPSALYMLNHDHNHAQQWKPDAATIALTDNRLDQSQVKRHASIYCVCQRPDFRRNQAKLLCGPHQRERSWQRPACCLSLGLAWQFKWGWSE